MYKTAIVKLIARQDLARKEVEEVLMQIAEAQLTPAQMGSFLAALAVKGETAEELTGLATVLRERSLKIDADELASRAVDTCGTGGSLFPKINTSTLVAFILAAAGVPVAKHGNRSSTGRCGSMDVLEQLGVQIDLTPEQAQRLLKSQGIACMFAPRFHPALGPVGPVRREIGYRTVFNFLGPLVNPAGVRRQVLGVSDRRRAPIMLEALRLLGSEHVLVVHGADGLDELTLTGTTLIWELHQGQIHSSSIEPEDLGLTRVSAEHIAGGDPRQNGELFMAVLEGQAPLPLKQMTLLNAAAGFYVAGRAANLHEGLALAEDSLASGKAKDKFEEYRAATLKITNCSEA